ncbi:MAG TPA: adenylate/guanylate cyclase domain-containing protein [Opitutaceae bacterium]
MKAWIETTGGERIELSANCYLGRSSSNSVHLKSVAASRRHAHIHAQEADNGTEYWIADLGSTNGTLRNGKRITIPCRLRDGDKIDILEDAFTFHLEEAPALATLESNAPFTVPVRAKQQVWFLMLDIKRYTILSRQLDTDTLSLKVGTWLRQARDVIEPSGGVVDKFLGDAIFAYWKHDALAPMRVSEALQKLVLMQAAKDPDFRIVLHHGAAVVSGGAGGADNLSGPEVISVFRMEKVCSGLGNDSIVSEPARAGLPPTCLTEPVGSHPLDGFPGTHVMHRLAQTS